MTDDPTLLQLAAAWQPQRPGDRRPRDIRDALVEPDWEGLRVLGVVDEDEAVFVRDGRPVTVPGELATAMRDAFNALGALLEGQLTTRALHTGEGVKVPSAPVERPSLIVPRALRRKDDPWVRAQEHERRAATEAAAVTSALAEGSRHAFVATDLLWLDGMPLEDIPLLERKRLLASVIDESELVRVGAYVTAASIATHVTWSAMGFRELHYRAANSRYRAGEANPDCAVGPPPTSIGAASGS